MATRPPACACSRSPTAPGPRARRRRSTRSRRPRAVRATRATPRTSSRSTRASPASSDGAALLALGVQPRPDRKRAGEPLQRAAAGGDSGSGPAAQHLPPGAARGDRGLRDRRRPHLLRRGRGEQRARARARRAPEQGRLDPRTLAEPIGRLVETARQREGRIRDAIERAELPYTEVSDEVDRFIRAMEGTAARAQLLYEALSESPPIGVEQRLGQVRGDRGKEELTRALETQLTVLRRMEAQLERFFTEMERILVELDTVRGNLVSVSASTESVNQQRLASEVRELREELSAVAEGMSEAYEQPSKAAG